MTQVSALDDFIENSPIAIVKLNREGQIVRCNRAFHTLTQNALESRLPALFVELLAANKKADGEAIIKKALSGNVPTTMQSFELALPSGPELIVSAYFGAAPSSTEADHLILHLVDITEQKNLELRFSHSQKMDS